MAGKKKPGDESFDAGKWAREQPEKKQQEDEERERVRQELSLSKARKSVSEWKRHAQALAHELTIAEEQLEVLLALGEPQKPLVIRPKKRQKKNQSVAGIVVSDLHIDEEIRPDQVSGLNRYNVEIAEQRLENLWRNGLALVNTARATTQIDRLLLFILGDLYSGHIHEDLVEVTAFSPTESVSWLFPRLVAGIDYLLEHGDFEVIDLIFKIGNHSRLTRKARIQTLEKHSLEWLLYRFIALHYEDEPRIHADLTPGYHTIVDAYGFRMRAHHGDWLGYSGGIGGLGIPLNKAINQWNKALRVDLDVIGHWHWYESTIGRCIVNGSGIGYGPFSVRIKGDFEPPQQAFFTISEKYLRNTLRAPIILE